MRGCVLHLQVTVPAKVLLDAGEDVPSELMANILKFQLLQVKASDQQRRAARQVSPNQAQMFRTCWSHKALRYIFNINKTKSSLAEKISHFCFIFYENILFLGCEWSAPLT